MRKRILAIFLAAVALACLLWGCKETTNGGTGASDETTPSSGEATVKLKEITVGIAQDLDDSLDPYLTTAAGTREVMFNVFEGLVKPDSTGNYVCAVASDYDVTESGRCYAFTCGTVWCFTTVPCAHLRTFYIPFKPAPIPQ